MVYAASMVVALVLTNADALNERIRAEGLMWQAAPARAFATPPALSGQPFLTDIDAQAHAQRMTRMPAPASRSATTSDPYFSWRDRSGKDFTTTPKDQGTCGACFVFASLASVETQFAIALDAPDYEPDLSEQDVISCLQFGSCESGGTGQEVANYLKNTGAVDEGCLPYVGAGTACGAGACANYDDRIVRVVDWHSTILPPDVSELKDMLLAGPVATSMRVYDDLYDYSSGVYSRTDGATYQGWHMVELVGWDDGDNSFIAKNSWGEGFGDQGFFKISQDDDCDTFMTEGVCFAANAVTFDVSPSEAPPFPCVEPQDVTVTAELGDDPVNQLVTLSNCGGKTLLWDAGAAPSEVSLLPVTSGSLTTQQSKPLTVSIDPNDFTPGTHTLVVPFESQLGDVANLTVSFKVTYTPPAVDFSSSVTGGVAPLNVVFTNLTSGEAQGFSWDFGDGTDSTVISPVHTFGSAGSYTVKLAATHLTGVASKTKVITVTAPTTPTEPGTTTPPDDTGSSATGGCAALPNSAMAPWVVFLVGLLWPRRRA